MSSQSAGRRRSNMRQYSAEDQALNMISKEAENRLAAKRAARAEAREIRLKEMERQHKESEKQDRQLSSDTAKNRQLGGSRSGSRRGSTDSNESESKDVDFKMELRELEDKYKAAMMTSAQLDNEKQSLVYQVELLKDQLEEQDEGYTELQRQYKDKCRDFDFQKRDLQSVEHELSILKQQLEIKDRLIEDSGFVIIANDRGEPALAKQTSGSSPSNGPLPSGAVLVSEETKEFLEKAGGGTLGTGISDVQTNTIGVDNKVNVAASESASDPSVSVGDENNECDKSAKETETKPVYTADASTFNTGKEANVSDVSSSIDRAGLETLHEDSRSVVPTNVTVTNEHGVSVVPVEDGDGGALSLSGAATKIKRSRSFRSASVESEEGDEFYDAVTTPLPKDGAWTFDIGTDIADKKSQTCRGKGGEISTPEPKDPSQNLEIQGVTECESCTENTEAERNKDTLNLDLTDIVACQVKEMEAVRVEEDKRVLTQNFTVVEAKSEGPKETVEKEEIDEVQVGDQALEQVVSAETVLSPKNGSEEEEKSDSVNLHDKEIESQEKEEKSEAIDNEEEFKDGEEDEKSEAANLKEKESELVEIQEKLDVLDPNEKKLVTREKDETPEPGDIRAEDLGSEVTDETPGSVDIEEKELGSGDVDETPGSVDIEEKELGSGDLDETPESVDIEEKELGSGDKDETPGSVDCKEKELDDREKEKKSEDDLTNNDHSSMAEATIESYHEKMVPSDDPKDKVASPCEHSADIQIPLISEKGAETEEAIVESAEDEKHLMKAETLNKRIDEANKNKELATDENLNVCAAQKDDSVANSACADSSVLTDLSDNEIDSNLLKDSGLASSCGSESKLDKLPENSIKDTDFESGEKQVGLEPEAESQCGQTAGVESEFSEGEGLNDSAYGFSDIDEGLDVDNNPQSADVVPESSNVAGVKDNSPGDSEQNLTQEVKTKTKLKRGKAKKSKSKDDSNSSKRETKEDKSKKKKKMEQCITEPSSLVDTLETATVVKAESQDSLEPEDLEGALDKEMSQTEAGISKTHKKSKKLGFFKKVFK